MEAIGRYLYGSWEDALQESDHSLSKVTSGVKLITIVAVLVYSFVGSPFFGHSGKGLPPMYGDLEAQRHWMEVTVNLPLGEWYQHTAGNDLLYWGLDYPPLTAYVSYIFGKIAQWIVPELVEMTASRGCESLGCIAFMRYSVILCDLLIYIPAAAWTAYKMRSRLVLLLLALHPSLLLIDHGHFQYNGVCIGLSLMAVLSICQDYDVAGSVLFSLALNFKQMTLYYSPVFFFVLLSKVLHTGRRQGLVAGMQHLARIGGSVIATFVVLWGPFCLFPLGDSTCASSTFQVLRRLFPFSRGIFEDKVANVWYVVSVMVDFRQWMPPEELARVSLVLTLVLILPVGVAIMGRPAGKRGAEDTVTGRVGAGVDIAVFLLALVTSALAFFLASFQVHEKSLLLALVPSAALVSFRDKRESSNDAYGSVVWWFQLVGMFTMHPLLLKDGQVVTYWVCFLATAHSASLPWRSHFTNLREKRKSNVVSHIMHYLALLSFIGMIALHGFQLARPALLHDRYPDLYPALFSIYGAANLLVMYLYFLYRLFVSAGWGQLNDVKKD